MISILAIANSSTAICINLFVRIHLLIIDILILLGKRNKTTEMIFIGVTIVRITFQGCVVS